MQVFAQSTANVQALRSVKVINIDESGEELRFPSGITYDRDADEIYVTSPQKNKLVVMTPDYFPYLSIGSGRGLSSISKSFIKDGLLYVCLGASMTEPRPHIAIYDMAFMPVKQVFFPEFELFSPLGLVVGKNGNLYVVGLNGTGVMVLSSDGKFLRWIEPKDEVLEVEEKAPILALDIGIDGRLYFVSEAMGRVFVYSPDEKFLYKFGEKGGEPGKLSRPRGIAVDDVRRQVYLVDYQRHTMSVYSMAGEYLFEVGGMGRGRGWFFYPSDLIVDGQGRIVVADTFNHRLQVFEFISSRGFGAEGRAARAEVAIVSEIADSIRIRSLKQDISTDRPGDFLIVTGLAKQPEDAAAQQLQLSRKGYPAQIQTIDKGKSGIWHQVFVGPYVDPLEAYEIAEKIRVEEGLPAVLKTLGLPLELELPREKPGAAESEEAAVELGLTKEIVLPEIAVPGVDSPDKVFPSVELLNRLDSLPDDQDHAPLERMLKQQPEDGAIEVPAEQFNRLESLPDDQNHASLKKMLQHRPEKHPLEKPEPSLPNEQIKVSSGGLRNSVDAKGKSSQKLSASAAKTAPANMMAERIAACLKCHDQQITKVCYRCHTDEWAVRLAIKPDLMAKRLAVCLKCHEKSIIRVCQRCHNDEQMVVGQ